MQIARPSEWFVATKVSLQNVQYIDIQGHMCEPCDLAEHMLTYCFVSGNKKDSVEPSSIRKGSVVSEKDL